MSGLLDKATEKADGADTKVLDDAETKPKPEAGGGLLEKGTASSGVSIRAPVDDDIPAWLKYGSVAGVILLIGFIAYQLMMGFNMGGYSITLTEIDIDEDDNAIRVQIAIGTPMFGSISSDEVQLSISYGDQVVWTGTDTVDQALNWVEIPFSEFYQGNSRDPTGAGQHTFYSVTASQGAVNDTLVISPPNEMDRTVDSVLVEFMEVKENNDCPGTGDSSTEDDSAGPGTHGICHVGMWFRLGVGITDPFNEGMLWEVATDYTLDISIWRDGVNTGNSFSKVSVNGLKTSWGSSLLTTESGGMVLDSWMNLGGTALVIGGDGASYVERGNFFDDTDGCYSLEVTVTHLDGFGDSFTVNTDGIQVYWDENENRADGDDYKSSIAC